MNILLNLSRSIMQFSSLHFKSVFNAKPLLTSQLKRIASISIVVILTLMITLPTQASEVSNNGTNHVPLPDIFYHAKAINYSADRYRAFGDNPSVTAAEVDQDLNLLKSANFKLLRLFTAADPSPLILERIRLNHPQMKVQLGIFLVGQPQAEINGGAPPWDAQTCVNANQAIIQEGINLANAYPDVVTAVSVGNEDFLGEFQPLVATARYVPASSPVACVAQLIEQVQAGTNRSVPVTTTQISDFYLGLLTDPNRNEVMDPQDILAVVDYLQPNVYPWFTTAAHAEYLFMTTFDWRQLNRPEGKKRGKAMMRKAAREFKEIIKEISQVEYINAESKIVKVLNTLPIVVGETGWKSYRSDQRPLAPEPFPDPAPPLVDQYYNLNPLYNTVTQIEPYAALHSNQKLYLELLETKVPRGQGNLPVNYFIFQAFDSQGKGLDDGWGLWDSVRSPKEALCETAAGAACDDPNFKTLGYYPKLVGGNPNVTVSPEDAWIGYFTFRNVPYELGGFEYFSIPGLALSETSAVFGSTGVGEGELVIKVNRSIVDGCPDQGCIDFFKYGWSESNSYVERRDLSGKNITFSGFVKENSLPTSTTGAFLNGALAFIKVFDTNFGYLGGAFAPLVEEQPFTLNFDATGIPFDIIVQTGFLTNGSLLQNPQGRVVIEVPTKTPQGVNNTRKSCDKDDENCDDDFSDDHEDDD